MKTILNLLQQDGIDPIHASGEEWHSPCPECGGVDRFSSFPNQRNSNGKYMGGRFHCRKCSMGTGDAANYLMKRRGLSFWDACKYIEVDQGIMPEYRTGNIKSVWEPAQPKEAPPALWQAKAERFMMYCVKQLAGNSGALKWLNDERGLSLKTITDSRLGWNSKDLFLDRKEWGLSPEISTKTGQQKKLWIAQGLVVPFCLDAAVLRIRIRRSEPPAKGSRYVVVSGSSMQPMTLWTDQQAVCVVESELDCLLISQECGDLVGTVALGSAQLKPDAELHQRLMAAKRVLVSLDSDPAGAKAVAFWRQYPGFKRWMAIKGKDPTEQLKSGIPIRAWIEAGLL